MTESANIVDPVLLIRVPQAFRPGMSDVALYEATRGVWKVGRRRDNARYALAVIEGMVKDVFDISYWQPALTTPYATRKLDVNLARGRWEFIGKRAADDIRQRYLGKSVAHYLKKGAQNPIAYVNVPV
jgi:uncharacterized protein